jgi:hypothetical protein
MGPSEEPSLGRSIQPDRAVVKPETCRGQHIHHQIPEADPSGRASGAAEPNHDASAISASDRSAQYRRPARCAHATKGDAKVFARAFSRRDRKGLTLGSARHVETPDDNPNPLEPPTRRTIRQEPDKRVAFPDGVPGSLVGNSCRPQESSMHRSRHLDVARGTGRTPTAAGTQ